MATIVLKRAANKLPFAPIVGGLFALAAAILVMSTPIWLLESGVEKAGIANLISAAAPPLGLKARALLALLAALGTGAVIWTALSLGGRTAVLGKSARSWVPAKTFAKSAPAADDALVVEEAPARRRRPIFAGHELGAPFMSDEALANAPILPAALEDDFDADELVLDAVLTEESEVLELAASAADEQISLDPPSVNVADFETVSPFEAEHAPTSAPVRDFAQEIPVVEEAELPPPSAKSFEMGQQPITAIPVPPPVEGHSVESLSALVQRLEQGLDNRAATFAAVQATADAAMAVTAVDQAPQHTPTAPLETAQKEVDSALRQALNTLERLAANSR